MRTEIMLITPELAGDWLARNTKNRRMKDAIVKRLARAIEDGQWVLNGEAIIHTKSGVLADGQHRLAAVVMANRTIEAVVIWDAPDDAYETIDTGARRGFVDSLYVNGETNYSLLSSIALWQWRYDRDKMGVSVDGSTRPTGHELAVVLKEHPELRGAADRYGEINQSFKWIPKSLAVFLYHKFSEVDEEAAARFFGMVARGNDLSEGHPVFALRIRLIDNRSLKAKLSTEHIAALVIKVWNAYRAGQQIQVLQFRKDEVFPTIGKVTAAASRSRRKRAEKGVITVTAITPNGASATAPIAVPS